ncbi:hypothetical protein [Luteolibacter luteus]|uniref:Uncharacterized protein n=1 Tax=Luteolibacter luteus TaxID=2728835 RepID=A0A858RJX7_9BACT|nr:hypothetical protein [Luteolibacter luteus]QJE97025.1 hypothetical protein HHL09_14935 [Luteolibacter luteus]
MSELLEKTGGAKIGLMNASWPMAKLRVTARSLQLKVTFLGSYTFTPETVVSLERYAVIPALGWGIRIHHNVATYPARIIFWCTGSPDALLSQIHASGFQAQGPASSVPRPKGIPVRWQALAVLLIGWNILFLMDGPLFLMDAPFLPGKFSMLAMGLVCASSVATLYSSSFQHLILKPGRDLDEIKAPLKLIALVTGFMTAAFALLNIARFFN